MFLHFEVIKGCHQFISILVSQKTSPTILPGKYSPFQLWPPPVPSSLDTKKGPGLGDTDKDTFTAGQFQIFQVDVDKRRVFLGGIRVGPLKLSARNKTTWQFFLGYKVTHPSHFCLSCLDFQKSGSLQTTKKHEKKHLPVQQKAMISSKRSCCWQNVLLNLKCWLHRRSKHKRLRTSSCWRRTLAN